MAQILMINPFQNRQIYHYYGLMLLDSTIQKAESYKNKSTNRTNSQDVVNDIKRDSILLTLRYHALLQRAFDRTSGAPITISEEVVGSFLHDGPGKYEIEGEIDKPTSLDVVTIRANRKLQTQRRRINSPTHAILMQLKQLYDEIGRPVGFLRINAGLYEEHIPDYMVKISNYLPNVFVNLNDGICENRPELASWFRLIYILEKPLSLPNKMNPRSVLLINRTEYPYKVLLAMDTFKETPHGNVTEFSRNGIGKIYKGYQILEERGTRFTFKHPIIDEFTKIDSIRPMATLTNEKGRTFAELKDLLFATGVLRTITSRGMKMESQLVSITPVSRPLGNRQAQFLLAEVFNRITESLKDGIPTQTFGITYIAEKGAGKTTMSKLLLKEMELQIPGIKPGHIGIIDSDAYGQYLTKQLISPTPIEYSTIASYTSDDKSLLNTIMEMILDKNGVTNVKKLDQISTSKERFIMSEYLDAFFKIINGKAIDELGIPAMIKQTWWYDQVVSSITAPRIMIAPLHTTTEQANGLRDSTIFNFATIYDTRQAVMNRGNDYRAELLLRKVYKELITSNHTILSAIDLYQLPLQHLRKPR